MPGALGSLFPGCVVPIKHLPFSEMQLPHLKVGVLESPHVALRRGLALGWGHQGEVKDMLFLT